MAYDVFSDGGLQREPYGEKIAMATNKERDNTMKDVKHISARCEALLSRIQPRGMQTAVCLESVDDMDVTELCNWFRRLLPLISSLGD